MKTRCYNPKSKSYHRYGGRGIAVCDRWKDSFENFIADMGPRPSPDHSIDRIDNDGHYEPGNCRWASRKEQCRNKETNRVFTIGGESRTLREWCEIYGVAYTTVHYRIQRMGWGIERALTAPLLPQREVALKNPIRGEQRAGSKLTDDKVREVRRLIAGGMSQKKVAALIGVSPGLIFLVANGRIWRHVAD